VDVAEQNLHAPRGDAVFEQPRHDPRVKPGERRRASGVTRRMIPAARAAS
jgi:hypothetical protein